VKPVVVSMIDVAASGGYMISYRASKIVADPMTITDRSARSTPSSTWPVSTTNWGSPGTDFEKGPNGLLYSDHQDFTEEQRARFEDNHWTVSTNGSTTSPSTAVFPPISWRSLPWGACGREDRRRRTS